MNTEYNRTGENGRAHRWYTVAGIRVRWCQLAHANAGVLGARWGAVAQCAKCGRQWRTPWAVAVQATPRGHLVPIFDHQVVNEDAHPGHQGHPGKETHPEWGTGTGVGAFVVAGVVVGVLMAGGLVGGLLGWLMGMGRGLAPRARRTLGQEWRRRVRNTLMLGLGVGTGMRMGMGKGKGPENA